MRCAFCWCFFDTFGGCYRGSGDVKRKTKPASTDEEECNEIEKGLQVLEHHVKTVVGFEQGGFGVLRELFVRLNKQLKDVRQRISDLESRSNTT